MPILCGTYYPSENENRVAPPQIEPAPSADIPSLHITWRDGAYYVSIPRYDGGEVVRKEDAIALLQRAEAAEHALTYACKVLNELDPVAGFKRWETANLLAGARLTLKNRAAALANLFSSAAKEPRG